MRTIRKRWAPEIFSRWLRERESVPTDASYDPYVELQGKEKSAVLEALLNEQEGLCAYCMGPIDIERGTISIEHYVPRSPNAQGLERERGKRHALDWKNFLGVCSGYTPIRGRRVEHCDKRRGDKEITLRPADRLIPSNTHYSINLKKNELRRYEVEPLIRYEHKGKMCIDAEAAGRAGITEEEMRELQMQIDDVLNLNHDFLKLHRQGVWDSVRAQLEKCTKSGEKYSTKDIEEILSRLQSLDKDGRRREYTMAAIWWLKRRLSR